MDIQDKINYLQSFMTDQRIERMNAILAERTQYISVVIEDIFQAHNISAVLRSCDCFGIQDVHIMQGKNKYQVNSEISLGSSKWVSTHLYDKKDKSIASLYASLRQKGYRIVATSPHAKSIAPQDIDLSSPLALIMGAEAQGLSEEAFLEADECIKIPMYGFTESFNISVATAIILHALRERLEKENIEWRLNDEAAQQILFEWCKNSVKNSDKLLEKYRMANTSN
ncbi:MAG: RNA methyltransferase [Pseudomonadota bacterium]